MQGNNLNLKKNNAQWYDYAWDIILNVHDLLTLMKLSNFHYMYSLRVQAYTVAAGELKIINITFERKLLEIYLSFFERFLFF